MNPFLFWLGADAESALIETETLAQLAKERLPVRADLTDPQADE